MRARPLVMVVDDSKPFLMYLSVLLNRMNLEVLPVTSPSEALEIAHITRPHLMTLDMRMPEMDGLATLRAMRQDKDLADLPVIMISSYIEKNWQWEAMSLGCIDVLAKPVDLRRLHKAIQQCKLYPEGPRRYLRSVFEKPVDLYHEGRVQNVPGVTLSERGIFVHMRQPLPKGTPVDVEFTLQSGVKLKVGGSVIYTKAQSGNDTLLAQGMAIKFTRMTGRDITRLSELVAELLVADLPSPEAVPAAESN